MVGILCADIAVRDNSHGFKRRVLLPLAAGLALGVNAFNALTLGLLGLPGLGLLFLFRWVGT